MGTQCWSSTGRAGAKNHHIAENRNRGTRSPLLQKFGLVVGNRELSTFVQKPDLGLRWHSIHRVSRADKLSFLCLFFLMLLKGVRVEKTTYGPTIEY